MSKSSKQTTEQKPPSWAQPMFEKSADVGMKLFDSGVGGRTYMGSTVADLSGTTMQGVNQLAQAGQGWDTAGTRNLFAGIGGAAAGPSYAEGNLSDMASGKFLQEGNPFYRQRMEQDLSDTAAQVRSTMSGAGRLGSGAETRELTNRLGNIRLQGLESDYNRAMSNMLSSNQLMDAARFGGLDRAQTAASSMAGLDQQNFENRLAGAGATLQAGQLMDQHSQAQIADEVAKFYALDNEDWTRLGMLQGAAAGAAGPYGTQLSTSRQPIGIGGIASGIGSLFSGKSDVRLKENIIRIGEMNGIGIYEFNYRGQPDRWRGVMAQELPLGSDAVVMEDDGYLAVDYSRLGMVMEAAHV